MVNQRRLNDASLPPGDLADWDLGVNIDLPDPAAEPRGWFADIERIAKFLADLRTSSGRDFIIGITDNDRKISEDLFTIDSGTPDLAMLRRLIGVGDDPS